MKEENANRMAREEQRMREDCEEAIERMKEGMIECEKIEGFNKAANDLHQMYNAFVESGFTEEQAWELTKMFFNNTTTKRGLF